MKLFAKAINVIVWTLLLMIPIGGLIVGIMDLIKAPFEFLKTIFNITVACFLLLTIFGLLGLVIKWTEKVIKK